MTLNSIKIIQPDDWHVHLRENEMMEAVAKYTYRINNRCVAMPNLNTPITSSKLAIEYKNNIKLVSQNIDFLPLIPCYLTDEMNLEDFEYALKKEVFFGAKLYPVNATTNSTIGVSSK